MRKMEDMVRLKEEEMGMRGKEKDGEVDGMRGRLEEGERERERLEREIEEAKEEMSKMKGDRKGEGKEC